ncbi:MAG: ABC transporter permease [Acidimicrobiia bacterium]
MTPGDELRRADPGLSERTDQTGIGPTMLIPSATATIETPQGPQGERRSQWQLFRRRFFRHRLAVASIVVLVVLAVLCFGAAWFAPYDPKSQDLLLGPVAPNGSHWFGTDELGRDQLSRLLYAGQISLAIGFAVALISTVIGTSIGAVAGYFGQATDRTLMWFTDLFLVVPEIAILAIALKYFGQEDITIVLVLAGLFWMYDARVVRGQVLSLKEKEFIEAARSVGASPFRIITRHILPNAIGPIVVNATLAVAGAIIAESTLSFLGFGVQPPDTSWGNMLADAEGYIGTSQAYLLYFPGIAILITVLAVNFLGDGLRDAFDPQSGRQ